MELKDIITAAEEAKLDSGIITAIKALDTSAEVTRLTKELESEQGKSAGILEDKKKYKERAETAETKIKEAEKAKMPEDERHKQELQELKELLETKQAEQEDQAKQFAKTQREAKLADLTSDIHWKQDTPNHTAKLIVANALTDIDLSDESKVSEAMKQVAETHKSFIAADAPGGTGGNSGGDGANSTNKASSIADNQKAIWGAK